MLEKKDNFEVEFRKKSRIGTLIGVLFLLLAIGGYVFYTKTIANELSTLKADVSTKNATVADYQARLSEVESASQAYEVTTEVQKMETSKSIPLALNQDDVIRDLRKIADEYKIKLSSISFSLGSTNYEGVGSLGLGATFEGNYEDLLSFLKGLEQNSRFIRVNTVGVEMNEIGGLDLLRASFSLSMEVFYQLSAE
jgi:Tfp pilus assembly protein PilO